MKKEPSSLYHLNFSAILALESIPGSSSFCHFIFLPSPGPALHFSNHFSAMLLKGASSTDNKSRMTKQLSNPRQSNHRQPGMSCSCPTVILLPPVSLSSLAAVFGRPHNASRQCHQPS